MVIGNYLIVKTWGLLEKRFADSKQLVVKSYSQVPDKDLQPRGPLFFSRFFYMQELADPGEFFTRGMPDDMFPVCGGGSPGLNACIFRWW